jgi:hypothetical protein
MDTAFQVNAFQQNAFQIEIAEEFICDPGITLQWTTVEAVMASSTVEVTISCHD